MIEEGWSNKSGGGGPSEVMLRGVAWPVAGWGGAHRCSVFRAKLSGWDHIV